MTTSGSPFTSQYCLDLLSESVMDVAENSLDAGWFIHLLEGAPLNAIVKCTRQAGLRRSIGPKQCSDL